MSMKVVVALGGNALSAPGEIGDITDQFRHSREMAKPLTDLVQRGWQLSLTHGNGPQVGSIMRRVELTLGKIYPIDLGLAVSNTQGSMGYMIAQTLRNELFKRGLDRGCTPIVTSVLVDANDPAFANPSKPIGPFLDAVAAERHRKEEGWIIVEDSGRGFRRVVASPRPLKIIEMPTLRRLVDAGELIVAGGGGGIPVIQNEIGEYHGVEAVIDKDLTSALLAVGLEADVLAIVTGVEFVSTNFRKPDERRLERVRVDELDRLRAEGHFAAGSMLPKIDAAIDFLRARRTPSARAIITDWEHLVPAMDGRTGTMITL